MIIFLNVSDEKKLKKSNHKEVNDEELWDKLIMSRLHDSNALDLKIFLNKISKNTIKKYKILKVDLKSCKNFNDVANRFAGVFPAPEGFGANADALYEILNDVPYGRYIVFVEGCKSLPPGIYTKLLMTFVKPDDDMNYVDVQMIFVLS